MCSSFAGGFFINQGIAGIKAIKRYSLIMVPLLAVIIKFKEWVP
jgi:hypothetical protein